MDDLRYPIGKLQPGKSPDTDEERKRLIDAIAEVPERLRQALAGLNGKQLDTPYREGGWNARQVTHHLADSHMNAYVRYKLALTEEQPDDQTIQSKLLGPNSPTAASLQLT